MTRANVSVSDGGLFHAGSIDNLRESLQIEGAKSELQTDGNLSIKAGFLSFTEGAAGSIGGDLLLDGGTVDGNPIGGGANVTDSKASLSVNQSLDVGIETGQYALAITGGATTRAEQARVGVKAGGKGTISVDGAKSVLQTIGNGLAVGLAGNGKITLANGAALLVQADFTAGFGVGFESTSQGRIEADGAKTVIDSTGAELKVGISSGSHGSILVSSGAQLLLGKNCTIGESGSGGITGMGGSKISLSGPGTTLTIGKNAGSQGSLSIQNTKGTLTIDSPLIVGAQGTGFLGAGQGATITTTLGTEIAQKSGSTGNVVIDGAGTTWTEKLGVAIGGSNLADAVGGTGSVTVSNQATLHSGTILLLANNGSITLDATGRVSVGGNAVTPGFVRISGNGYLLGTGTIHGGVIAASGATVAPGYLNSSPVGTLKIDGTYQQASGAVLGIDFKGVVPGSGFDVLTVTGSATLQGNLHIKRLNGFTPAAGAEFTVLQPAPSSGNSPK